MTPGLDNPFRVARGSLTRSKVVHFTFDGETYEGLEGDTLASALLANGVHLVGRSFKYHRPRGIMTAGVEEPNALVTVSRGNARKTPNVRATVQEVYDGLTATSQNAWPSLHFDLGAVNDLLSPVFSAGFYYKTFKWPPKAWDALYEPLIRRAAGLGEAPTEPDPDRYTNRFAHCDVLVVGGGAAGLVAARRAADAGKSVVLCDENPAFGGWLLSDSDARIDGQTGPDWVAGMVAELKRRDTVTLLPRTTGFGYFQQNMVALAERMTDHMAQPDPDLPRERLWQVRAAQVVLAQGGIERPLVFPGNDRPGVMLAGAAQTYLNKYGVALGQNIAVFTACDTAYAAAFDLYEAGSNVAVIVDHRDRVPDELREQAQALGIRIVAGASVSRVHGHLRVSGINIRAHAGGKAEEIEADALLMSGGWTPSLHLFSQSRGKPLWDAATERFLPGKGPQANRSVGLCNGTDTLAQTCAEASGGSFTPTIEDDISTAGGMIGACKTAGPQARSKAFVDFQNDVTVKDIRQAVREGMQSIEHVKRYTTNGMATDQGKLSNLHGLAIAADMLAKPVPQVGLTTFRAPYTPTTFATLVANSKGALFHPERRTPIDGWAQEHGAVFEPVAHWRRAFYFPQSGEDMRAAVARECAIVRETGGLFDASTLGKIEVCGPDAETFLDLLYTNSFGRLKPGRAKYALMLHDDGFIFDDGIVARLSDTRFHVTTTTGNAAQVLAHMEDFAQTEVSHLNVSLASTTEQWATIAVQGPQARAIIEPFVSGAELSDAALPHMALVECNVCGVPARLFRVSFTGELGYEINVPADFGRSVWEHLWERAKVLGACVYGTETMHVLRAEKGYILVGQDTDGTVTPHDAGLSWALAGSKRDYVGKRGLLREDLVRQGRRQLVGLKTKDPTIVLEDGAQLVADPDEAVPMTALGFVTSSYWSPTLNRSIALALVEGGAGRMGETLFVPMEDGPIEVEVTATVAYDPSGKRLNGAADTEADDHV